MLALMRYAYLFLAVFPVASIAHATDWLTLPSSYSHDPATGSRVSQFAPIEAPTAPQVDRTIANVVVQNPSVCMTFISI